VTVVLREWETFAGSNTPVVGATVNVRAASSTNPNVGAVVASTTTNASGMWEFTSLADATYDVDITYNGRTRWRKGNSKFSNSLTGSNFATQTANTVFAGPSSGAAATPTFRALVAADFPAYAAITFPAGSVTQGALPTYNVGSSRILRLGKHIHWVLKLAFTNIGTAGTAINVILPFSVLAALVGGANIGGFIYYDSGTRYVGNLEVQGTATIVALVAHNCAGGIGAVPNFGIASGDELYLNVVTEEA
jgi:hypothetical protein